MHNKHHILIRVIGLCLIAVVCMGCRGDDIVVPAEYVVLPIEPRSEASFAANEPIGMYLLNEGNMGSNKATIDYVISAMATIFAIYTVSAIRT